MTCQPQRAGRRPKRLWGAQVVLLHPLAEDNPAVILATPAI